MCLCQGLCYGNMSFKVILTIHPATPYLFFFRSPELRPDATKDFSIYILDPLEDLMSKSRHGQSSGVAVAMGLLSIILSPSTPDSVTVNGTFVPCGQNESALEVVVSLKQVCGLTMFS